MPDVAQTFRKDPEANLLYGFDWTNWLASGESVSASVWTVAAGLTGGAEDIGSYTTTIFLSGGTDGETYEVENKMTASDGQIAERSFVVIVGERGG